LELVCRGCHLDSGGGRAGSVARQVMEPPLFSSPLRGPGALQGAVGAPHPSRPVQTCSAACRCLQARRCLVMVPLLKVPWYKRQVPDEVCLGMGYPFLMIRTPLPGALRAAGRALGAIGPCPGSPSRRRPPRSLCGSGGRRKATSRCCAHDDLCRRG